MLKNVIHQIDSKNEWLLLSKSFTAKFELVFDLALEKAFSQKFHFEANRKSIDSSKKVIFKIALCLRDRHIFMWQSVEILNDFNTLTLKQIFRKTKTFFKKKWITVF